MTGDQIWGTVGVLVGTVMLLLRRYIFVDGREVDRYKPESNLAHPARKPKAQQDQAVVIMAGVIMIGAGLLYAFGVLPRE